MHIDPKQSTVTLVEESEESWLKKVNSQGTVHGVQFKYRVVDTNYRNRNEWLALIQVSDERYAAGSGELGRQVARGNRILYSCPPPIFAASQTRSFSNVE